MRGAIFATAVSAGLGLVSAAFGNQVPINVSGYNQDMVVETGATFGAPAITATMDGGTSLSGNTWYQVGQNTSAPTTGLPSGQTVTSLSDSTTQFALASAVGNNALLLNSGSTSGTLTLATPAAYSSLAIATSSGNGAGTFNYTVNYQDGTSTSGTGVTAPDWFGSNAAIAANGRINSGGYDNVNNAGMNPNLYEVSLPNVTSTSPITSIDFNGWTGQNGNTNTVIMALSGTAVSVPEPASLGLLGLGGLGLMARRRRA